MKTDFEICCTCGEEEVELTCDDCSDGVCSDCVILRETETVDFNQCKSCYNAETARNSIGIDQTMTEEQQQMLSVVVESIDQVLRCFKS